VSGRFVAPELRGAPRVARVCTCGARMFGRPGWCCDRSPASEHVTRVQPNRPYPLVFDTVERCFVTAADAAALGGADG
jgi:hypothetical protein